MSANIALLKICMAVINRKLYLPFEVTCGDEVGYSLGNDQVH